MFVFIEVLHRLRFIFSCLQCLIKSPAKLEVQDLQGQTALHKVRGFRLRAPR